MDLSNSVIMPRDDFYELQSAAWDQTPATFKQKLGTAATGTLFIAGAGAAVVGATWGWAKAMDWLEKRRLDRTIVELDHRAANKQSK